MSMATASGSMTCSEALSSSSSSSSSRSLSSDGRGFFVASEALARSCRGQVGGRVSSSSVPGDRRSTGRRHLLLFLLARQRQHHTTLSCCCWCCSSSRFPARFASLIYLAESSDITTISHMRHPNRSTHTSASTCTALSAT
jgi:hypothetical protein